MNTRTRPTLDRLHERYGAAVNAEIERWLAPGDGGSFYGMMRYQLGFVEGDLVTPSLPAGKRSRPLLCLLACQAVGGTWRKSLPAAAAVELLHNFSLVHDDIEDRDPTRHGRPAVWTLWREPQAINVGDALFALACQAIASIEGDPATTLRLARALNRSCLLLTEGQYMDMSFEQRSMVSPSEYLMMIERKTAALIAFSLWCGAMVGGASPDSAEALREFGADVGRAYQIYDDIMGIWGRMEETGKEPAQDLRNRKKTFPLLVAWERANPVQQSLLADFLSEGSREIEPIIDILDELGAHEQSRQQAELFLRRARSHLAAAPIPPEYREEMEALAGELVDQR